MKKIKQWLTSFVIACEGFAITLTGIGTIVFFIEMINSTGKEFLVAFLLFLLMLLTFIFSPYLAFKDFQLLTKDKDTKDKKIKEEENTFDTSKGLITSDNINVITKATFMLMGYDKDNDIYETIMNSMDFLSLIETGKNFAKYQKETDHFKSSKGEPFDWFVIKKKDDIYPCACYWVSYNNEEGK